MQSSLLAFANECSATCVRLLAYIGGVVVLAIVAIKAFGTVQAAIDTSPRAQWADVERPLRAFAARVPEFTDAEPGYAIRRHTSGDGRKDVMRWGPRWTDGSDSGSRLMLEVYRPGREIDRFGDPASAVGTLTAELGGPYTLTPAAPIDSKFGRFAVVAFTARSGSQPRNCLGFAQAFEDPRMQIAGWYCKGNDEVVERGPPICALERLSLLMAASEPKVAALFGRAELHRKPCAAPARKQQASNGRRHDWIDARKAPKLRTRLLTP